MIETEILTAQTSSFLGPQFILLLGFIAVMYFLIIRPQNKRIKAQKEMIDNLAVGDEIISSGGLVCACLLYTSPSPRDATLSRMPSSA